MITHPRPDQKLTVVTYNVHEWVGTDGKRDPARVIGVIRKLDAEIIALQEVSLEPGRDRDILSELVQGAGMELLAGPTLFRKNADFGNLLLFVHPLLNFCKLDLSIPGREPRGAIIATFSIHRLPVTVVTTHLGLRARERRVQVSRLTQEINKAMDHPVIVLGDLNEWNPFSPIFRHRFSLFANFAKSTPLPTYPSFFPVLPLDRVLVYPPGRLLKSSVCRTPMAHTASDHLPLRSTISLSSGMP